MNASVRCTRSPDTARPRDRRATSRASARKLPAHLLLGLQREKGPHDGGGIRRSQRCEFLGASLHVYRTTGKPEGSACRDAVHAAAARRAATVRHRRQRRAGLSLRAALELQEVRRSAASGQPLATDSSVFGFSKNCSSSVEFLSAVVDAWLPWIVVVIASK